LTLQSYLQNHKAWVLFGFFFSQEHDGSAVGSYSNPTGTYVCATKERKELE
jgi:hypothetical protein